MEGGRARCWVQWRMGRPDISTDQLTIFPSPPPLSTTIFPPAIFSASAWLMLLRNREVQWGWTISSSHPRTDVHVHTHVHATSTAGDAASAASVASAASAASASAASAGAAAVAAGTAAGTVAAGRRCRKGHALRIARWVWLSMAYEKARREAKQSRQSLLTQAICLCFRIVSSTAERAACFTWP